MATSGSARALGEFPLSFVLRREKRTELHLRVMSAAGAERGGWRALLPNGWLLGAFLVGRELTGRSPGVQGTVGISGAKQVNGAKVPWKCAILGHVLS